MTCPNCGKDMTAWPLDSRTGTPLTIDVCTACQAFWFDQHESLQLSPASTLKLMKYIGEHSSTAKPALAPLLRCPRCQGRLSLANDMVHSMHFNYWVCAADRGRFIGFFDFLKEKNFIRTLSPQEITQLKKNVQSVNCCNCGAAIDLQTNSACPYCHSALSILDMKQPEQMLAQLQQAAEPHPADPTLPLKLALARQQVSSVFADADAQVWQDSRPGDLVVSSLKAVSRLLSKFV